MNQGSTDRKPQLQIVFAFIFIFSVLLFLIRPEPTRGQVIVRVGMAAVGLIGLGLVSRSGRP